MSGKKYVFTILGLSLTGALYAFIYGKIEKHKLEILPKKYVYNKYEPSSTFVLFIRDLDYKEQYFQYVKDNISEKNTIAINFPLDNILPKGEIIYVRSYSPDSNLVEFYNPTYHHKLWGFTTGYIHRNFVHDTFTRNNSNK